MPILHRIISYPGEIRGLIQPVSLDVFPQFYLTFKFQYRALTFSTGRAAMGPLSSVQSLVGLQAVWVPQRFSTVATEEAAPGVGKHVPTQLWLLGETLVALGARVRLLSVVNPQMTLEVP